MTCNFFGSSAFLECSLAKELVKHRLPLAALQSPARVVGHRFLLKNLAARRVLNDEGEFCDLVVYRQEPWLEYEAFRIDRDDIHLADLNIVEAEITERAGSC